MGMIDARHLTKAFGAVTAVDDLSFQVEEGEIFGFLGPNGAGKTTTLRMLCCLIAPTGGDAFIPARRPLQRPPDSAGRQHRLALPLMRRRETT
jgi:ABC-2 type transport system ATP-binding protein